MKKFVAFVGVAGLAVLVGGVVGAYSIHTAVAQESCSAPPPEEEKQFTNNEEGYEEKKVLEKEMKAFAAAKVKEGYEILDSDLYERTSQITVVDQEAGDYRVERSIDFRLPKKVSWKGFKIGLFKAGAAKRFWGSTSCKHHTKRFAPHIDWGRFRVKKGKTRSIPLGHKTVKLEEQSHVEDVVHYFGRITYAKKPETKASPSPSPTPVRETIEIRMREEAKAVEKVTPPVKRPFSSSGMKKPAVSTQKKVTPGAKSSGSSSSSTYEVKKNGQWVKIPADEYKKLKDGGAKVSQ